MRGSKRKVLCMDAEMTKLYTFNSTCEAAHELGLTQQTVYNYLKNGRQHKASGFYFAPADIE